MRAGPRWSWGTLAAGLLVVLPLLFVLGSGFRHDPHEMDRPLVGRPAPDFVVANLSDGHPIRLADMQGRPVVLNFWATWCVPCRHEHPILVDGAQRWGKEVAFLGVVYQDEKERIEDWLDRYGRTPYPTGVDTGGRAAIAYGVYGVPETYFVNRDGVIVWKQVGPLSPAVLEARIREIL